MPRCMKIISVPPIRLSAHFSSRHSLITCPHRHGMAERGGAR
jgi:hypothetical protein